jgi:hypothetical protein
MTVDLEWVAGVDIGRTSVAAGKADLVSMTFSSGGLLEESEMSES